MESYNDLQKQIISACIFDPTWAAEFLASTSNKIFGDQNYRDIFNVISDITVDGNTADIAILKQRCDPNVISLIVQTPPIITTPKNAVEILKASQASENALRVAQDLQRGVSRGDTLASVQRAITGLLEAHSDDGSESNAQSLALSALEEVDRWEDGVVDEFVPSGFAKLDEAVGGFPLGELTIIAGMTGAGKTSLMCQIILNCAQRGDACLLFSAEMSATQIIHRMASIMSRVPLWKVRKNLASSTEVNTYRRAIHAIADMPVWIVDDPSPDLSVMYAQAMRLKAKHNLKLVGFDYDEKMSSQAQSEELRVSQIAQNMKAFAKRMKVALVALSQYSRSAHPEFRPSNDWLRYSGKKEHEAALIIHWYFPYYWVRKDPQCTPRDYDSRDKERGFLVISKNRFGAITDVNLWFNMEITKFQETPIRG